MTIVTEYAIIAKEENAHDEPIYCSTWGTIKATDTEPAKDFIVTGGRDCLIKVWHFVNNKLNLIQTLEGHSLAVVSVTISPDGYTLASSSMDSSLIIWDLVSGQKVHVIDNVAMHIWQAAFSPDGMLLAVGGQLGNILTINLENGKVIKDFSSRSRCVFSVAWSPNGKFIACGTGDGEVMLLDAFQGKLLSTACTKADRIRNLDFSPNSKMLAIASHDGFVRVYNIANETIVNKFDHKAWALDVCHSADGSRLATAAADGSVRVLSAINQLEVLYCFKVHTSLVYNIKFDATGDRLMSTSKDGSIVVYECPKPPKVLPVKK